MRAPARPRRRTPSAGPCRPGTAGTGSGTRSAGRPTPTRSPHSGRPHRDPVTRPSRVKAAPRGAAALAAAVGQGVAEHQPEEARHAQGAVGRHAGDRGRHVHEHDPAPSRAAGSRAARSARPTRRRRPAPRRGAPSSGRQPARQRHETRGVGQHGPHGGFSAPRRSARRSGRTGRPRLPPPARRSASISTCEPGPAASIISPMMERASTVWPSRVTRISASKLGRQLARTWRRRGRAGRAR